MRALMSQSHNHIHTKMNRNAHAYAPSKIYGDVATTLKEIYLEIAKKNPSYSLRAFATKLGLSSGGLSQILSRKKKLSMSRAHEIAEILDLKESEKEQFVLLAQIEHAKSMSLKAELYERLNKFQTSTGTVQNLALDHFKMISEWYGLAILELLATRGASWSPQVIAEYLDISKTEVDLTLERLLRLELIEPNGKDTYARVANHVVVSSGVPSEAIRKYYKGVFEKAITSITTQTPSEKIIGTEVFAFDVSQLDKVKKLTDEYLDQLLVLARKGGSRKDLYQAVVNVFRLNTKIKKRMENDNEK